MVIDLQTQYCRRVFDLDPHQVRYLLETFTVRTIERDWLIGRGEQAKLRRRLGMPKRRAGNGQKGVNGHGGGISAWRTPDRMRA